MARFFEVYKSLIIAITLSGIYFKSIEKIWGNKFYVKLLKVLCFLPGICMPIHLGAAIKYLIFDVYDERSRIFGYTVALFSAFMFLTFYSFYYSRREYEKLFELWDSMFQEEMFPELRKELLKKNIKLTIRWLKGFGGLLTLSILVYFMVMYFSPSKKVTHPSGFPYRHQSPDFELVNTLDLVVAGFGCSGLIAFDSMTMAFISMEEAQLQHLKISLSRILDAVSVDDVGNVRLKSVSGEIIEEEPDPHQMTKAFEEITKQVRIWIIHHQQLLRFHNEFQRVYSVPLSAKFLYFVFILCLACFLMLAGALSPLDIAFTIQYFVNNYTVFYVNVIHADRVMDISNTIFGDAFDRSWHLCPKELKTWFHIIQMQSHRPLHYLAFKKYPLSSSSFLKMLSSTYSLFTFLIQINRKKN